jgi:tetratricopeptide (TPR) repeat protein
MPGFDGREVGRGGKAIVREATLPTSLAASYFRRMGFWRRLFGSSGGADDLRPQRLDYLNEALALERQGDYDAALTSYRLALRDHPTDARILQNMAIAFTKTRRYDEAIRHYRRALELDASLAGAHYGLAFLLLQRGDPDGAAQHLKTFLAHPPRGPDAQKWIEHAAQALQDLRASGGTATPPRAARAQEGP